ncbi:MAG: MFS transporter [Deltaproteobacteria bacterium]|nr:MFS transporter [Deltaproteobacteria bacterium]MBW2362465.1 MFS transporter [Deltaproteobacteria bacterium]
METPDETQGPGVGVSRGRIAWIVFGCFVCQLALGYGYVFGPLLTDITADLDLSRAAFSSSRTASMLGMAATSPLIGLLVLRAGSRAVVVASTLLMVLASLWLSRAESLWHLYVGYAMHGVFTTGLGDIVLGGVVSQWVSRGRGFALGLVYTGSNVGATIFVAIATQVALTQSWRESILTIGLGGAVVILPFAALVVRDRRAGDGSLALVTAPEEIAAAEPAAGAEPEDLTLRQALRTRSFWILYFALLVFFFYFLAVIDHFVPTLEDAGMDKRTAAMYFRYAILMGLVSKVGMGVLADALSGRTAFVVNHALFTLSSGLLLVLGAPGIVPLFVIVFGFSYAARDVVYPLIIAECFGVKHMVLIYGVMMTVILPASAGGIFAGWVFDRFGSYDSGYATFAVLNLVVLATLFALRPERTATSSYTAVP